MKNQVQIENPVLIGSTGLYGEEIITEELRK